MRTNILYTSNKENVEMGTAYPITLFHFCAKVEKCSKSTRIDCLTITLIDAMSYGKCVIYSDIPENAEVAEGVGIPFRNKDVDDLAEKIKFTLSNPEYCKQLGEKARERVKKEYNWDKIVSQTEEVYQSLFR